MKSDRTGMATCCTELIQVRSLQPQPNRRTNAAQTVLDRSSLNASSSTAKSGPGFNRFLPRPISLHGSHGIAARHETRSRIYCPLTRPADSKSFFNIFLRRMDTAPDAGGGSGCNIPCRGAPQTGHASAFKVISAPQHVQKAATSFSLHGLYRCLDERTNCKDSR
jgi:hypothetical protein